MEILIDKLIFLYKSLTSFLFPNMCVQKIVAFFSLLTPLTWFIWLTYVAILPMCAILGWLALPFAFFAMIIANVLVLFRLIKKDDGLFTPTRDALQEIFPRASSQQIARYEKIVNQADELDPVLIISPNLNWINQYGEQAYHLVMDGFATEGLQNARRDENSRCVFHFRNGRELVDVRDAIRQRLINAFYIPPSLQATHPHGQTVPVGTAWILTKVGARDSDFWEDDSFFLTL
ncbi:hypothetical protein GLOIN_2v187985 [Rhizophagus irregularis DAOM 181602=DAOM 197198]|uniref:Uncharacterized protein n=1 Tax=Rhizophagus irregularis (strain DAOM 181602 / DAOM 197198 / MUCL 43194) TaxID=747089 RepID=A0A2P4PV22_RHIID|nr:hypothetical protein GLOIN_2v187985 [Rhizophagus irregularis DAOM 181602=DAOM 197198]POG69249.1 hypothetical protein GLOIN_2v187985 [Rhizophagus irregularis DAOM 181602=DAOM 197198]|eukprot:XP_025176115.1 hypothetical protein GLOIN_2v187985 [Rhizophagus irregularis DAOM 181602=DAOM 197198]